MKKVNDIVNHPYQEMPYKGKPLRNVMKGGFRVHIGSFVLVYGIDDTQKLVTLKGFEHRDKVYSN
jgi:mRNA-degrading endonuclease RelE of RelBE toxin-antitoxin system